MEPPPLIASVRFWRAIRPHLPDTDEGNALYVRLRHEPREARKRHMPWKVPLTPDEEAMVHALMAHPPTPYVAFCVQHHADDALANAAAREDQS